MKLTYWIADCLDDSRVYSIREKTRKAAAAARLASGNPEGFGQPRKVEIHYADALDLARALLGEGGGEGVPAENDK